jgi:hypothetical protein
MNPPLMVNDYNPAKEDGIHAKIWECLRRNVDFCTLLDGLRADDPIKRKVAEEELFSRLGNPLARIAYLVSFSPEEYSGIEEKPWPEVPNDIREIVNQATFEEMPQLVPPPPVDAIARLSQKSGRRGIASWFFAAQHLWHIHTVISVPKFIRDTKHKKEVINRLIKFLPDQPVSALKLRDDLPSGGKLLGTKRDWEIFLFIETLEKRKGFQKGQALELSALRFYDADEFAAYPLSYFKTSPGKKQAEAAYVSRGEKIAKHLEPIESGLHLVYPDFKVFLRLTTAAPNTLKK